MSVKTENIAKLAAEELEELLAIVGDLSYVGYRISLCKLKGLSHQQCANKHQVSKSDAQYYWEKCMRKQYDHALKRIFNLA